MVTLSWSWEQISNWLDLISFNGSLGRIFHDVLIYVLAKVGWDMGGVAGMCLIGFAILLLNNILFYPLLRRIDFPRVAALFGVLVFALFAPEFTQVFLTHALGIHPGVTCLLVAAHLFLADRRLPALIVVVPCLFIYESVYLLFLAVPLLALAHPGRPPGSAGEAVKV